MNFNPLIIVGRNQINGGLYCLKYFWTRLAHSNGGPNYIFIFAICSPWNLRGGNQDEENKYWKKLQFGWILFGRSIKVKLPQHVATNNSQTKLIAFEFFIFIFCGRNVGFSFLSSRICSLWNPSGKLDCIDLGHDYFLIKFDCPQDLDKVLMGGPWFIGQ